MTLKEQEVLESVKTEMRGEDLQSIDDFDLMLRVVNDLREKLLNAKGIGSIPVGKPPKKSWMKGATGED